MLNVENLFSGYGEITILHGITMKVPEKAIITVVGANGVGKTTFLKTITGLLPATNGSIDFSGIPLTGCAPHEIVKHGISMVPEGRQLFPGLTVKENLEIGSTLPEAKAQRAQRLEEQFSLFPKLKERLSQLAGTLSGGEQQMLATARSLMSKPRLLLLDEPSWGLAPILVTELFDKIQLIKESGASVLLVEQNVTKSLEIADYGYVFEGGQIKAEGPGKELLQDGNLKKAYLGI